MVRSVARKKEWLRILFWPIACALLFTAAPSLAAAQFKAWVMAKLPDTPEGLGVDSHGNLYATLMHIGEVVMVKDNGSYDHIAWVPSKEERRSQMEFVRHYSQFIQAFLAGKVLTAVRGIQGTPFPRRLQGTALRN